MRKVALDRIITTDIAASRIPSIMEPAQSGMCVCIAQHRPRQMRVIITLKTAAQSSKRTTFTDGSCV